VTYRPPATARCSANCEHCKAMTEQRRPMTERQAAFLESLCEDAGYRFNPRWRREWSLNRASREIGQLLNDRQRRWAR
jgi:hypothetical protein